MLWTFWDTFKHYFPGSLWKFLTFLKFCFVVPSVDGKESNQSINRCPSPSSPPSISPTPVIVSMDFWGNSDQSFVTSKPVTPELANIGGEIAKPVFEAMAVEDSGKNLPNFVWKIKIFSSFFVCAEILVFFLVGNSFMAAPPTPAVQKWSAVCGFPKAM